MAMLHRYAMMMPSLRVLCSPQARCMSQYGVKTVKPLKVKAKKKLNSNRVKTQEFLGMDGSFEENYRKLEDIVSEAESVSRMDLRPEPDDPVISRSMRQQEKRVEKALIRRKYFRPEPEPNLLTWDAKAQMRYLHATDPETWTPQQLAQSFPISVEGASKVVKQHWVPRSLQEVIRHDERVHKNWLALKACGESGNTEGPLYNRYQRLVEEGKLYLLSHATGIQSLPQPEQKLLPETGSVVEPVQGRFTAIIKDYCDKKAQEKEPPKIPQISDMKQLRNENMKLIGSVVKSSVKEDSEAIEAKLKATYSKATLKEEMLPEEFKSEADERFPGKEELKERQERPLRRGRPLRARREEQWLENVDIDRDMPKLRTLRKRRDTRIQLHEFLGTEADIPEPSKPKNQAKDSWKPLNQTVNMKDIDKLGIEGTGKISSRAEHRRKSLDSIERELAQENVPKFKRNPGADRFFDNLQYETDGKETEVYMYEEGKGYSYPFGRKKDIPQDLEKAPQVDKESRVYRKNNVVYDEDGEFLFRAPTKE